MSVEGDEGSFTVEATGFNMRNPGIFGQSGNIGHHIRPGLPPIGAKLKVAVVSTYPEYALIPGGFSNSVDGAVIFGA